MVNWSKKNFFFKFVSHRFRTFPRREMLNSIDIELTDPVIFSNHRLSLYGLEIVSDDLTGTFGK